MSPRFVAISRNYYRIFANRLQQNRHFWPKYRNIFRKHAYIFTLDLTSPNWSRTTWEMINHHATVVKILEFHDLKFSRVKTFNCIISLPECSTHTLSLTHTHTHTLTHTLTNRPVCRGGEVGPCSNIRSLMFFWSLYTSDWRIGMVELKWVRSWY